jgi:hypothetical protein
MGGNGKNNHGVPAPIFHPVQPWTVSLGQLGMAALCNALSC